MMKREHEDIYYFSNMAEEGPGKFRLAESGLGWMSLSKTKVVTVPETIFERFSWLRCTRKFQLRIETKEGKHFMFNGFNRDDYDSIAYIVRSLFDKGLEQKKQSFNGWNWGNLELKDSTLEFNVDEQLIFDLHLNSLSNSSVVVRNEISLEFQSNLDNDPSGKKSPDEMLVEMKFYIPNTSAQQSNVTNPLEKVHKLPKLKQSDSNGSGEYVQNGHHSDDPKKDDVTTDALTPEYLLVEAIKQKAGLTGSVGEPIMSLGDLLCLIPRGRFELEIHPGFFRLRGKSHDYKIIFSSINTLFSLPKPDEVHHFFVIGLRNPLLHGQTRYPYLVFHLGIEEELQINVEPQESNEKKEWADKLEKSYNGSIHTVLEKITNTLTNVEVTCSTEFRASSKRAGVKCAYKANEAFLFPLENLTLSLVKPVISLMHSDVVSITFSRVGLTETESFKTFEIAYSMANGRDYVFTSISREDYYPLEQFYKSKKIKVITESIENSSFAGRKMASSFSDNVYRHGKRYRDDNDDDFNDDDVDQNSSDASDYVAESESEDMDEYDDEYKGESDDEES